MANANIGHIKCPLLNEWCVVRTDCRGKKYYYSQAGKVTPNLPQGQEWINENAILWQSPDRPPAEVTVKTVVNGAPPVVTVNASERPSAPQIEHEKPLTPQGEEKPLEKPLTPPVEKRKKQSALSYLLGGSDD